MLTWIRFPVMCFFCLLKIKCRDTRQTDRLAERKYVRFLQWLWKTYSSCIHSLVAVTLWSSNIWPLKFLVTNIFLVPTTLSRLKSVSQSLMHKSSISSSNFKYNQVPAIFAVNSCVCHERGNEMPRSWVVFSHSAVLDFLAFIWIRCCHSSM